MCSRPCSVVATFKYIDFVAFEKIKKYLRIFETLPETSRDFEHFFPALRRLKTYNRSSMLEVCLKGLCLMRFHKQIVTYTKYGF